MAIITFYAIMCLLCRILTRFHSKLELLNTMTRCKTLPYHPAILQTKTTIPSIYHLVVPCCCLSVRIRTCRCSGQPTIGGPMVQDLEAMLQSEQTRSCWAASRMRTTNRCF
ncbi:hypothetical protein BDQ17DRAFT_675690 [Cyathus striatus]|nr:hypothetical protein BDQ17DRAFT_675690 [Cyathus striatus]